MDKLKRDALELEAGKSGRTVSFKPVLYQAIELMMAVLRKLLRTK